MKYETDSRKNCASQMKREQLFSVSHFAIPLSTFNCQLSTVNWIHTFSAKEKDAETGYSYFGSRYYSSDLSIWLSVDPMSDKYPSMSPYVYCANNPIKLVDPNGEEFDIDGYIYVPGQNCPEDASQETKDKWQSMNKIYEKGGAATTVMNAMSESKLRFKISSEASSKGKGQYASNGDHSGGTIFLNGNNTNLKILAHEMFHGYQDMKEHREKCIFNEIEANLFTTMIGLGNALVNSPENVDGLYTNTLNKLLMGKSFDEESFGFILNNFKDCANANYSGTYDDYPNFAKDNPNGESLIKQFFPIFSAP